MSRAARVGWKWAATGAGLLTAAWVTAVVLMLDRGFDVTDEGFYLLSYRWWDSTPRAGTGTQYLYGPLFQLLDWNIPALRAAHLVATLLVHAVFGWTFMSWLRTRRPSAPESRGWQVAGTLVVVAAGGVTYSWLPLSPGYDQAVVLLSLLLATVVLWSLVSVANGSRLPLLAAAALGPCVVALVLAKWVTAFGVVPFVLVVGVLALHSAGARGWWRYLATAAASTLVCLVLLQLFVMPLPHLAHETVTLNRLVAAEGHSPAQILRLYLDSSLDILRPALRGAVVALAVSAAFAALHRLVPWRPLGWLVALGPVVGVVDLTGRTRVLPGGGTQYIPLATSVLILLSLVALAAVVLHRLLSLLERRRRPDSPSVATSGQVRWTTEAYVVALLVLLPGVQALGTNSALATLAVNQFACWAALLVAACTREGQPGVLRWLTVSATACALVVAVTTGMDGLLRNPYRTVGFDQATTSVGGPGSLGPMRVDAETAARFRAVEDAAGHLPVGTRVMAFDHMPGVVLLLGGRTVGEAWYDSEDFARTAAGIRSECRDSWPSSRDPVIIYSRKPTAVDTAALRACGFSLSSGFRKVEVRTGSPDLDIYLPTGS